jgi:hypothetical protein
LRTSTIKHTAEDQHKFHTLDHKPVEKKIEEKSNIPTIQPVEEKKLTTTTTVTGGLFPGGASKTPISATTSTTSATQETDKKSIAPLFGNNSTIKTDAASAPSDKNASSFSAPAITTSSKETPKEENKNGLGINAGLFKTQLSNPTATPMAPLISAATDPKLVIPAVNKPEESKFDAKSAEPKKEEPETKQDSQPKTEGIISKPGGLFGNINAKNSANTSTGGEINLSFLQSQNTNAETSDKKDEKKEGVSKPTFFSVI